MSLPAPRRAALVNLGCRVNRVELDSMATRLESAGFVLTGESDADYIVINTCAVTGEAEAKTRKAIRHAAARPQGPLVVATGCVASLFADELAALSPNVCVVANKREVADFVIAHAEANAKVLGEAEVSAPIHASVTPTGRTRPGVQVQDGCDNRCTYCIIWKARGKARSFDPDGIAREVRAAMGRGAHEVVLTGINLGDYRWGSGSVASSSKNGLVRRTLSANMRSSQKSPSTSQWSSTDSIVRVSVFSNIHSLLAFATMLPSASVIA